MGQRSISLGKDCKRRGIEETPSEELWEPWGKDRLAWGKIAKGIEPVGRSDYLAHSDERLARNCGNHGAKID